MASFDDDIVLDIIAKNVVGIYSQSICAGFDAVDLYIAGLRVDVSPILVSFGVENVVLKIDTVLG